MRSEKGSHEEAQASREGGKKCRICYMGMVNGMLNGWGRFKWCFVRKGETVVRPAEAKLLSGGLLPPAELLRLER